MPPCPLVRGSLRVFLHAVPQRRDVGSYRTLLEREPATNNLRERNFILSEHIDVAARGESVARLLAFPVMLVGVVILAGWGFGFASMMKPNTAVSCLLAGAALWLLSQPAPWTARRRQAGGVLALLVAGLGIVTLIQYLTGEMLHVDQLIFREATTLAGGPFPGRMAITTALSFALLGSALLLLDFETRGGLRPAEWCAVAVALIVYVGLLGSMYGADSLQRFGPYSSMAPHTGLSLLVLTVAVLFSRATRGIMGQLMSRSAGGSAGRQLLPAVLLVTPMLGWLRTLGEQAGWYEPAVGRALLIASIVVVFVAIIWRNVTRLDRIDADRLRAVQKLKEGQELLTAIVENTPAIVYVKDVQGRYLLVNRRWQEFFGKKVENVLGKTDYDIFDAEPAAAYRDMDLRIALNRRPLIEEEVATSRGGTQTFLSVKAPLLDEAGDATAIRGISTDITERKSVERQKAALHEDVRLAKEDAEALNNVALALASELDLQEVVQVATDAATKLTGAQYGAFFFDNVDPASDKYALYTLSGASRESFDSLGFPRTAELLEETFLHARPVRIADIRQRGGHGMPQGRPAVCSYLAVPVVSRSGKVLGGMVFGHPARDVFTERGERSALGVAAQTAIAIDNARLYLDAKHTQQRMEAQLGRLALLDQITRAIAQRQDLDSILQIVVNTIEERMPLDFGCICLYDQATSVLSVARVGIGSQSLACAMAVKEKASVPIDENGLGKCLQGQLAYEPDIAESPFPFLRRLAKAGLFSLVAAPLMVDDNVFGVLIAVRRKRASFSSAECEFLRQLSDHVGLAAHQAELHGALQTAYDDLRLTQQAVLQQERLRALGQMASGIAHDINNAISPASIYVQTLMEREELSAVVRDRLSVVHQAIDDVAKTVGRLREFYRPRDIEIDLEPVDLNHLVRDIVELTRARWRDIPQERGVLIELEMSLNAALPGVSGAATEIRDSLTNLIFNAVDAMPQGGTLRLRTDVTERHASIEVGDTGTGMDEETRRRCLEPFYTTKGLSGTGLGLAMVYGMVRRHNGELDIDSTPGKGTTIRICLPLRASVEPVEDRPAPRRPRVALRILLVDDDPLLLNSLCDALKADGHEVTTSNGGREAIDALRAAADHGQAFSIIITDLGMPKIDGRAVAAAARRISPATPVILLTGWGQRLIDQDDTPAFVSKVLPKPPDLVELRETLAALTTHG